MRPFITGQEKERRECLVSAAREMVADPHDMPARQRFVSRTFNIDHLAADIVALADTPNTGQEAD